MDVFPIAFRKIVEFFELSVDRRIYLLRTRISPGIELQHVVERVINSIVKKRFLQRDIPQGRGTKQAAKLRTVLEILSNRTTSAKVIESGIQVLGKLPIARDPEGNQAKIRELWRSAI